MPLQPTHSEATLVAEPGLPSTLPSRLLMGGLRDISTGYVILRRFEQKVRVMLPAWCVLTKWQERRRPQRDQRSYADRSVA